MVTVTPRARGVKQTKEALCNVGPQSLPLSGPILVNGVVIERAAIGRETQNHPAAKPIDAWQAAARALVIRELLLQEARSRGVVSDPLRDEEGRIETEEEAIIRSLVERDVQVPRATDSECRRYYEQNRARFSSPALFEVRHILLIADPSDSDACERARVEAQAIIAELVAAPHLFAEIAAVRSACPSASSGGNLGQISRGQTVPEFEAAIEQLATPGLCREPVETRYGFHVVDVERMIESIGLPFEAVRTRIAAWLDDRVWRTAQRHYIAELVSRATIVGIDLNVEGGSRAS